MTLGIDIFEDYYNGDFFRQAVEQWVGENVSLIVTQPQESLARMREIVQASYAQGRRPEAIARDINQAYDMSKAHARMIARDQTAKLNAQVTQAQQRDAGCDEYIWDSSGDQRVRPCHRALHGKKFKWSDPPEMWYETAHGRKYTGQHCHPGEWYQCRCIAVPVFNMEGIAELPVSAVDWKAVDDRYKAQMGAKTNLRTRRKSPRRTKRCACAN